MKKFLTNILFKFLFYRTDNFKDGDVLECMGDLFVFDSKYGNPNSLRFYSSIDGFWNYHSTISISCS